MDSSHDENNILTADDDMLDEWENEHVNENDPEETPDETLNPEGLPPDLKQFILSRLDFDKFIQYKYAPYVIIFAAAAFVFYLIYTFSAGFGISSHNWYNNYSRQAYSWLQGRLDLPENRPYLEIAFFQGRYYISFPPFPSIVMLPLVVLYGYNTPDHAVAFFFAFVSLTFAYKLAYSYLKDKKYAMFFSLFLILGTNYLHLSLWGSVWYLAQNMAFAFTLIAFYLAVSDKKHHSCLSLLAMCAAMGCRPFNIVYLPVLFYLLFKREDVPVNIFVKRLLVYAVPAMILGAFYMWLNYVRFGNIFEFGHNFLPEFMYDFEGLGQFHPSRIVPNMRMMFFNTDIAYGTHNGFPSFGQVAFAFWLASPILVSYIIYLIIWYNKKEQRGTDIMVWVIPGLVLLHLFAFSFHRTLGGRQFGGRYAADSLPAVYLGLLMLLNKMPPTKRVYANLVPALYGLLINFHGTILFLTFYFGS